MCPGLLLSLSLSLPLSVPLPVPSGGPDPHNVLILVADDLGLADVGVYGIGQDVPLTPTIDSLASRGVLFRNAYSNPICSPTRATMQTGRHSFRTGVGNLVLANSHALQTSEVTLPELLDLGTGGLYSHAAIGKWHLGNASVGGDLAPNMAGYSHFSGTLENFLTPFEYYNWPKVVNGVSSISSVYATTDQVNDALVWITQQTEPWLCYVGFNAPHSPYQLPPSGLHSIDISQLPGPEIPLREVFKGMVEAMDTEIGRLLNSLPPDVVANTTVIFIGDNGTDSAVISLPYGPRQSKRTVYQGGVNVPLIITGPHITQPGLESDALVMSGDIFATVAEIAGVDPATVVPPTTTIDSVSLVPYLVQPSLPSIRDTAFAELFTPNGPDPTFVLRMLRDTRYKLIERTDTADQFFDLQADPYEQVDLTKQVRNRDEERAYLRLKDQLVELVNSQ